DTEDLAELERYRVTLLDRVPTTPQLRSLATNPLLCAMLCALNRDRRTQLPQDRVELYRIALELLLERRDIERQIDNAEHPRLSLPQKTLLLRELGHWLMLNEQSDIDLETATERFRRRLDLMPQVTADASVIVKHFLVRSGLLREPIAGRIDFVHR